MLGRTWVALILLLGALASFHRAMAQGQVSASGAGQVDPSQARPAETWRPKSNLYHDPRLRPPSKADLPDVFLVSMSTEPLEDENGKPAPVPDKPALFIKVLKIPEPREPPARSREQPAGGGTTKSRKAAAKAKGKRSDTAKAPKKDVALLPIYDQERITRLQILFEQDQDAYLRAVAKIAKDEAKFAYDIVEDDDKDSPPALMFLREAGQEFKSISVRLSQRGALAIRVDRYTFVPPQDRHDSDDDFELVDRKFATYNHFP